MKKLIYILAFLITGFIQAQIATDSVAKYISIEGRIFKISNYTTVANAGVSLTAKDTVLTAAIDSLYASYSAFQTGVDALRPKILRKNNGRIDIFPTSETIPNNTIWRARTGAANDTVAINPANGYSLIFDGQTTGDAAYITGPYESMYIEKVATDTLLLAGANLIEYTYSACTVDPNELHLSSNAISDPTCNETNATTGWSVTESTLTSVTTDPQVGSYHFQAVATQGNSDRIEYNFSVTSGNTYTVSFLAKEANATNGSITSWVGFSDGPSLNGITGTWERYTYNVTANITGTATVRIYSDLNTGSPGGTIYVDDFSIIDTTP